MAAETITVDSNDLVHRIVGGTAVDQILADEGVDDGTADDVAWTLTDHLHRDSRGELRWIGPAHREGQRSFT